MAVSHVPDTCFSLSCCRNGATTQSCKMRVKPFLITRRKFFVPNHGLRDRNMCELKKLRDLALVDCTADLRCLGTSTDKGTQNFEGHQDLLADVLESKISLLSDHAALQTQCRTMQIVFSHALSVSVRARLLSRLHQVHGLGESHQETHRERSPRHTTPN